MLLNHFTTPQSNFYKKQIIIFNYEKNIYTIITIFGNVKNIMYLTKDFNESEILKK
jgi:hypothetical protein